MKFRQRRRPWRDPPPPARPSPAAALLFGMTANDSATPAGGSRGSLFGGRMQKQEHTAIQSDLPCISENRTATIGCPVFDDMGVFICNISAFALAFTGHRPLPIIHCSLLIANCQLSIRPQKKFPGTGPRKCIRYCKYGMPGGLRRGKSGRGRPPRDRPLRKASPGGTGRVNPKQIFRQASKLPMAIVDPYCNKLRL